MPVAGSTVNYPQIVWVNTSTSPDINFKLKYKDEESKGSNKTDI